MKKKEQIESELRTIIKNSKKGIFVNLTLTNLIEISRRMYVIYDNFKSGEKFKINNNDENISILNNVLKDFKKLNKNIDDIPNYLRDLILLESLDSFLEMVFLLNTPLATDLCISG